MKQRVLLLVSIVIMHYAQSQQPANSVLLPNGWTLTPAGKSISVGDLPLNLVISHDKKYAAITNNGQSVQTIDLIDIASKKRIDTILIAKSWYGLDFSYDDRYIYASGGHDNKVNRYRIYKNHLTCIDSFVLGKKWPHRIGTAGLQVDDIVNHKLFVVTREDSSLYVFDIASKKILHKIQLAGELYTCKLSPDRHKLYISQWGAGKIAVYDISKNAIIQTINVGSHPNEIIVSRNGKYLYVANANDNSVSVIYTPTYKVIETLNAALYPHALSGSTTNGLAISEDEKTLYVANADNNCLAVFDITHPGNSLSKGFIPTGWYPTNVKVAGHTIMVTNGKGLTSLANPYGPNPIDVKESVGRHMGDAAKPQKIQYIAGLFTGALSFINVPSPKQLAVYSQQVYKNTPYIKNMELVTEGEAGNPIPLKVGEKSPIKYVFYVIKENRTYDQVLGDINKGNGDSSLCIFGKNITPNQHQLVEDYVLLDNFYVNAEVSADGHNWSMGAYATDYLEKTWPSSYGGRGGTYGGEGERKIANNRDGFIWDQAARSHVTYRSYGEFVDDDKPTISVLNGHSAHYTGFDLHVRDTTRFFQWKKDFDSLLKIHALPQLTTLRFGNDHTEGMREGRPTPFAHVADNDLAVGMFVDYISKSPIWAQSAIFILEDDAQNGPDHVDAHRSTAYIISPYVKRHYVDHTLYSTTGMLRTIELILGMPPMTQYDAAATPMWRSFTNQADYTPYTCLPANVNMNDTNPFKTKLSAMSEKFNWRNEDDIPDLIFNDILWQGIKGTPAPAPVRAAFLKVSDKQDMD